MYLLNELLLFSPFVVYAAFRAGALFRRPRSRALFALAFVLAAAGYPVAHRLSHGPAGPLSDAAVRAGYYAATYLLYLVLTVVLVEAATLLLRAVGVLRPGSLRSDAARRARRAATFLVPAAVVLFGIVNLALVRVKRYEIAVPRRASTAERVRIAFVADLHLGRLTSAGFLDRAVDRINALRPDLVLVGGDVVEDRAATVPTARFEAALRRLRTRYGAFAVPGNHERYAGGREDFFSRSGIRLLRNEAVAVGRVLLLVGRAPGHAQVRPGSSRSLDTILRGAARDLPSVLLDHVPDDLEPARRTGIDLQLSGHTHMGQLFPVSLVTASLYEIAWGHLEKGGTHTIVTSGLGLWGPPVRTAGRSEIVLVDLVLR